MTQAKPFDVFLSHNSRDKPWAVKLKTALEARGLKVWLDKDEIRPGDLFGEALEQGIAQSANVALIVSPEAATSGWVKEEFNRALTLAIGGDIRLLPVILHDAEFDGLNNSPFGFRRNRLGRARSGGPGGWTAAVPVRPPGGPGRFPGWT